MDHNQTSSLLPSNKNRSLLVHSLIKYYGLLEPMGEPGTRAMLRVVSPILATVEDLNLYHARRYTDFVLNPRNYAQPDLNASECAEFGIEDVRELSRILSLCLLLDTGLSWLSFAPAVRSSSRGGCNNRYVFPSDSLIGPFLISSQLQMRCSEMRPTCPFVGTGEGTISHYCGTRIRRC